MVVKIKLICIDNDDGRYSLTLNNIYEGATVTNIASNTYLITDDDGIQRLFLKTRFITLTEWRQQQIDKILGDE